MNLTLTEKTLRAVSKATETDQDATWHRFVHVWSRDSVTTIEAATNDFAVAVDLVREDRGEEAEFVVDRRDVSRVKAGESLTVEAREAGARVTAPFEIDVDPADGTGLNLREPYPDLGERWWEEAKRARVAGHHGFAVHPRTLEKACGVLKTMGCEWVEIRSPTKVGDVVKLYAETPDGTRVLSVVRPADMYAGTENQEDTGGLFADTD